MGKIEAEPNGAAEIGAAPLTTMGWEGKNGSKCV